LYSARDDKKEKEVRLGGAATEGCGTLIAAGRRILSKI
jgi:hypothetical protein